LPIFHPPQPAGWSDSQDSHVSADGHVFPCADPKSMRQKFHVIFVLDRSGSMGCADRQPVPNTPSSARILRHNSNRFGAVLSALHGFWMSQTARNVGTRQDSYSVILFDSSPEIFIANDMDSPPDQLLEAIVEVYPGSLTNFNAALTSAQDVLEQHWSMERSPVIIFLSDGECNVSDNVVSDLCNRAVELGRPLSLHAVSFGEVRKSHSLKRMVAIAEQIAQAAPQDPQSSLVPCQYSDALSTIHLAETFLNIADSLQKPRASLFAVRSS